MLKSLVSVVFQKRNAEGSSEVAAQGDIEGRIKLIRQSGLFDTNWYKEVNNFSLDEEPDLVIRHYIEKGDADGRAPHPIFDLLYYREVATDLDSSKITALEHYIQIGFRCGLSPSPLFDPTWYKSNNQYLLADEVDAFHHFLHVGAISGISPHPLFDSNYYFSQDPSLASNGINPLTHFLECGALKGMNPNLMFDVGWYLRTYQDVHVANRNPLVHFILVGAKSGLLPHPEVDIAKYMHLNDKAPSDPLKAYLELVASGNALAKPSADVASASDEVRHDRRIQELSQFSLDKLSDVLTQADRLPAQFSGNGLDTSHSWHSELVSLDIWDTVLRRDCHPDEIKSQSARFLLIKFREFLRPGLRNQVALFNARISSENSSAPNDEFEFRFEDALSAWLNLVLLPSVDKDVRLHIKLRLTEHEFCAEQRATRVDNEVLAFLKQLRTPAIFASDFYFSSQWIRDLLQHHRLSNYFVRGYSSSDAYETKRSGKMFQRIIEDFSIEPAKLFHVGDNPHADIAVPSAMGIKTSSYVVESEAKRRTWFDEGFVAWRRENGNVHERRIAALAEDIAHGCNDGTERGSLLATGARLAPLMIGYILGLIQDAANRRISRVHYFTREGLFFRQVHDALVEADPYNMDYAVSEVLAVSRRATFAASLKDASPRSLMRLWTLYSKQSLKGLSASLNLDPIEVANLASEFGLDPSEVIVYPWRNEKYVKFITSTPFRDFAEASIEAQRKILLAYLREKGVDQKECVIISDIGWRGTIHDNIAQILPDTYFVGRYLGLFNFLNEQPNNVEKHGWIFDEPRGIASNIGDVAPLEMIFNGGGGSVAGYQVAESGVIVPKTTVFADEEELVSGPIADLQMGMLSAVRPIADYIRLHGLIAEDLRPLSRALAESISRQPPTAVADLFYRLHHNETFGTGEVEAIDGAEKLRSALTNLSGSDLHASTSRVISEARWPEGLLRTSIVSNWWQTSSYSSKSQVPTTLFGCYAPSAVRARGSRAAIFAPAPIVASGGHRTIFNMVRRLARAGFKPEIFLEGIGSGVQVVEEYLAGTQATIHTQWHKHIPSDLAIATIAHSALFVAELRNTHHRTYLVQDFEAQFNPMSDSYVIAENSYALGLQHFTIGNWLTHVINTRYGAPSAPAGLGVDTDTYFRFDKKLANKPPRELAVCFLYQPDKPRRTPLLGINALRLVKRAIPECKIYVFGSTLPLHLDFEVENLGLVTDLTQLNDLYNKCMAGLCISGSNPSRIPYEMMAAGCVPIDLYRYNNLLDHQAGTILLANQDPFSLADALLKVLQDQELFNEMSWAASRFVATRTLDWEVDVLTNNTLALLDGNLPTFKPLDDFIYAGAPVIVSGQINEEAARSFCEYQMLEAQRKPRMLF